MGPTVPNVTGPKRFESGWFQWVKAPDDLFFVWVVGDTAYFCFCSAAGRVDYAESPADVMADLVVHQDFNVEYRL